MRETKGTTSERREQLKSNDVLTALDKMKEFEGNEALKILQVILDSCSQGISGEFEEWQSVLIELLKLINGNIRDQSALLSGQIFLSILSRIMNPENLENHLRLFLSLKTEEFEVFGENFHVKDRETFQLIIINSCLSSNKQKLIFPIEIYCEMFKIIEKNCILYTRHTYLCFRLLNNLLEVTKTTNYFENSPEFEEKLEIIIMSNWDNCISDAAKLNSTGIFPKYLKIMSKKYPDYLQKSFNLLLTKLSWHNPTKYTILTEIFKCLKSPIKIPNHDILEIVESLSKSHLKHPSTKFYLAVWSDLDETNWLEFYKKIHETIKSWESEGNTSAIRFIWDLWFRPTLKKMSKSIFYSLWTLLFSDEMLVSQSFLVKLAVTRGVELTSLLDSSRSLRNPMNIWVKRGSSEVPFVLEDERECVRINGFFVYCSGAAFTSEDEDNDSSNFIDYKICENFIFFNARAASVSMRKDIMDNFKCFIERIVKINDNPDKIHFFQNLHEFLRNSFELGSCYQRRIMGLGLYEILLQSRENVNNPDYFHDLMRLCLDPVEDVREKSCSILCTYFPRISPEDQRILFEEGLKYCGSPKFYEVSGGGKLLKVFVKTTGKDLSNCLFKELKLQLFAMKKDILKATAQGSPFYGIIIALLDLNFNKNSSKTIINEEFVLDLLDLLEDASSFFLSSLSPRSEETKSSASFAEMGMAIEERINSSEMRIRKYEECALSPAHQTLLSCIWMSLASICNLSGELTYKVDENSIHKRSIDIVIKILIKCRHKGVIEVAGTVLVRLMKNENINHTYFIKYLEDLLTLDAHAEVNLTRRGAGQSIMFHRLIANDEKKTRPLLQIAMKIILKNLKNPGNSGVNSKQDNPLARQLHFLHRIVSDSSLHQVLIEYMEEIALTCFHNSMSPEWSIRNASLQLLGAVIPRVVGQSSDGELDFSTGFSMQHFLTHYPSLGKRIMEYLRESTNEARIMPILTLLSKMRVSGCEYIDYSSNEYRDEITREIHFLFKHPVSAVRNLAAKTFASLIPAYEIGETILQMANKNVDNLDDNFRHSHFSALMYLQVRAKQESSFPGDCERIREGVNGQLGRLNILFGKWRESGDYRVNYIVEGCFIKSILASKELGKCQGFFIDSEGDNFIRGRIGIEGDRIGFWEFIDYLVELHWVFTDFWDFWDGFEEIDRYSIFMMKHAGKISKKGNSEEFEGKLINLLGKILKIMENNDPMFEAYFPVIFEFIIRILENGEIKIFNLSSLLSEIVGKLVESENELLQRLGYSLSLINDEFDDKYRKMAFSFISKSIKSGDEIGKSWALNYLKNSLKKKKFSEIDENFRLKIIEALVSLLNDQIPEIRNSVHKKMISSELSLPKNSEIYLYEILKCSVMNSSPFASNPRFLENVISDNRNFSGDEDIKSPFEHDELYREDGKIINILTEFMNSSNSASNDAFHISRINSIGNSYQENYIKKLMEKHFHKLSAVLNMKIQDYLSSKIHNLKNTIK